MENKINILTKKARIDKAIQSIKGILIGIKSDSNINLKEIKELIIWIENSEFLNTNPFNEFNKILTNSINNNEINIEVIEDLYWLCCKYEDDNIYYNAVTSDLQVLQGIFHGILSDGIIKDEEIYSLSNWLKENEHLSTFYPYDEVQSIIVSILSDKKILEEERNILMAFFNNFVSLGSKETDNLIKNAIQDVNINGICSIDPIITFKDKLFCITGILSRETKSELNKKLIEIGAKVTDGLTKNTDYLIVADNNSPAWVFSCYGRKVEKAINLRKEGHQILLIHEFDLYDSIEDYKY